MAKRVSSARKPQSALRPSAALSSDVIRDLDVLRAESSARAAELQSLSAALEQMRSERDAFKSASEEAEEELKWYIGQLGALQKERNDEIILRWLQAAQGLSTIRAAGGGHLSSSRPAVPPHCRDPEQWLRGEALLGDLEAVTEAARSGRGGSEAERTAGPSNRTTAGCPDDAIGDLGVQPGAAPDPRVSTTSLQLPQSPPPLNRLGSMPVAFRDVLPTPGSQAALRDEPLGGPGGSSGRLAAMQAKIVELEAQQTAARGERAELLAELEKARAVASDAERRVGAAEESLRAAEARVAEAMQSTEEVRRVAATERDREVKALASRAQAAEDKVGRLEASLADVTADRSALRDRIAGLESELQAKTAALQQEAREERLRSEKARKRVQELEGVLRQASAEAESQAAQLQQSQEQQAALQREVAKHRAVTAKRADAEGQVAALLAAQADLEARYREARMLAERQEVALRDREAAVAHGEARSAALKADVGALRGQMDGLQALLQRERERTAALDSELSLTREKHDRTSMQATRAALLDEELQSTRLSLDAAEAAAASLRAQVERLQATLASTEDGKNDLHGSLAAALAEMRSLQGELVRSFSLAAVYRACTNAAESQCFEAQREAAAAREAAQSLQSSLDALQLTHARAQIDIQGLHRQLEGAREKKTTLKAALAARGVELEDARASGAALQRLLAEEQETSRSLQYQLNRAGERARDQEKACRESEARAAEADARTKELNERVQQVQESLAGARAQCTALKAQVAELTTARDELAAKSAGLETRLFESQKRARLAEVKLKETADKLAKANAQQGSGGDEVPMTPVTPLPHTPSTARHPSPGLPRVPSAGRGSSRGSPGPEDLSRDLAAREARIQALLAMAEERAGEVQGLQGEVAQVRRALEQQQARERKKDTLIKKLYAEVQACHQRIGDLGGAAAEPFKLDSSAACTPAPASAMASVDHVNPLTSAVMRVNSGRTLQLHSSTAV